MPTEATLYELETSVIRGIQAGIASARTGGQVPPEVVALLHAGLQRLFTASGPVELRGVGQFLELNGTRFPRGDQDRVFTRRLLRVLHHCGLAGLRIEPELGAAELQTALGVLGRSSLPGDLAGEVPGRLRRAQVTHLTTLTGRPAPRFAFPAGAGFTLHRALAQRLYLQALRLYRELGEDLAHGGGFRVHDIRRILQRMVDLMDEDDAPLIGLTSIKSLESYELTHAVNVTILAMALARAAGLARRDVEVVGLAAFLHDVGQMDVPAPVLARPGALSDAEWASVRRHPLHGAGRLLAGLPRAFAAPAALAALEHHLGATGDGYPKSADGYTTGAAARIVQIVDTYDALTSRRVFRRESIRPDRALTLLVEDAGRKYDPVLVKLFVRTLGLFPPGTTVRLDTGEVGVVVRANRSRRMLHRPQVCLVLGAGGEPLELGTVVDLTESAGAANGFRRSITGTLDPEPLEIAPPAMFLGLV